jgi:hypothetical protein
MSLYRSGYLLKYYFVIMITVLFATPFSVNAQDVIVKANGEVVNGKIKHESSEAINFKPDGSKRYVTFSASEIISYYNSTAGLNFISRHAGNSKHIIFFPDLNTVHSAMQYEFQDGELEVIPCGEVKVYRYKVLGPEEIHGGRMEFLDIYLENKELGLMKIFGEDISREKQLEVLLTFTNGKQYLDAEFNPPVKVTPRNIDDLIVYFNAVALRSSK